MLIFESCRPNTGHVPCRYLSASNVNGSFGNLTRQAPHTILNMHCDFRELDTQALRAGFDGLIGRHESLRTTFRPGKDGSAEQVIQPVLQIDIASIYASGCFRA